ncbi:MAG: hypothetical protein L6R38_004181 [Xanthoria sp. 2 TBL-2021]|nr:MAG: hypothetical protein L6R38_004181 [Xanthoria sp. 2 TBL-2021]
MSWRSSCLQRRLQPKKYCWRGLSTTSLQTPNIASVLALPPRDDGGNVTIQVSGTVRTIRKQKQRAFLQLGDGSTVHCLQAVLNPDHAQGLSTGAFVAIQGLWRPAPPGKEQSHELHAQHVTIIGAADSENYPIQKKFQTAEFLRSIPHLRLRLPLHALLARLRSESEFLLAQYFRDRSFLRVQSPVITSSDCEGAGHVFSLDTRAPVPEEHREGSVEESSFFRKPKYLTVSSQLHLEAYMQEHPKVWTFSPTFRAEKSDTPRHVSEFWMLEVEMRTQSLQEVMNLVEDMIKSLIQGLQQCSFMEELVTMRRSRGNLQTEEPLGDDEPLPTRWATLEEGPWPRITYAEALRLLQDSAGSGKSKFFHDPSWESGLQLEHEKYIAATVGAGKPVFVTHYPRIVKPFYMLPSATENNDSTVVPRTAACFDLLLPEVCEVVGGSLREHRLEELEASMPLPGPGPEGKSSSESKEPSYSSAATKGRGNLDWYLDLRRFGSVPHGGFGLGFDRLLCYLTGVRNIKDVVPWPRFHGRCDC